MECTTCDGHGEQTVEATGWWNGSGVFVDSYECADCGGTGSVDVADGVEA